MKVCFGVRVRMKQYGDGPTLLSVALGGSESRCLCTSVALSPGGSAVRGL